MGKIPLFLVFTLMILAIPVATRLTQQNQNIQNRAAIGDKCLEIDETDCFSTPCCAGLLCQIGTCKFPDLKKNETIKCSLATQLSSRYCTKNSKYSNFCSEAKSIESNCKK